LPPSFSVDDDAITWSLSSDGDFILNQPKNYWKSTSGVKASAFGL